MSKLTKIIRMEFKLTAANKLFIILTILGPFLIAAVTVLPTALANSGARMGSPETRIAMTGPDRGLIDAAGPALAASKIRLVAAQGDVASLDAEVLSGTLDGYIVLPPDLIQAPKLQFVSKSAGDPRVLAVLQGVIGQAIVAQRLVKAGISPAEVAALTQPPALELRQLTRTGEKKSADFLTVLMTGLVLAMLLYMTVLLYGQVIGRSVLSEKTSKTVEIMLSSVRPMDLLFGKILGKVAASLLQYGIWVGVTMGFFTLFGQRLGVPLSLGFGLPTLLYLVLFFLLAFFLYCSLYAALGAASQDEQHLGQLAWPMILFLVLPVIMIFPIISSPQAPFIVGLSFFPLTAPIVMFLRILVGAARTWEVLVSVGVLLASIAGVIVLSAKIFRVGLLMTGKRFKISEIWRLAAWK